MRHMIIGTGAIALLALTGCDIPEEEPEGSDQAEQVDALEERMSDLEDSAVDLQQKVSDQNATITELTDASPETTEDADEVEEVADDEEAPAEEEQDQAEDSGDPGDLTSIGDPAPLTDEFTGIEVGTITLNEIERDFMHPECEEWGDTPESGEFVALHLTVDVSDEVGESVYVWEDDFYLVDAGDTMHRNALHTATAWSCSFSAGTIETAQPGTNVSGVVLLDTTIKSGTLGFDGGGSDVRWEF